MLQEDMIVVAIIVGMIMGSLCMISALFYLLQLGNPPQVWGIVAACVGGGVFVLSAVLMAVLTLRRDKKTRSIPAPPPSTPEPEPEPENPPEPASMSPSNGMPELDDDDFDASFDLAEDEKDEKGTA
jgi:hypothetical protein